MNKASVLQWFLRIAAIIQVGYWSIPHLFFPEWYLRSIGLMELAENPGDSLLFLNEIGIFSLTFAIATWIASTNPVKYFEIIILLLIAALGSICISIYHILILDMVAGEVVTIAVLAFQVIIIVSLYPWQEERWAEKARTSLGEDSG